jgi:hypothetical protein
MADITPATVEPVTLALAKDHLRIGSLDSSHDVWLTRTLRTVRRRVEALLGLRLITCLVAQYMDAWTMQDQSEVVTPTGSIPDVDDSFELMIRPVAPLPTLPVPPPTSVLSIKTVAEGGTETTVATTVYLLSYVDQFAFPRITLRGGQTWPSLSRATDVVVVQYYAGFGETAAVVPDELTDAIYAGVEYLFTNRGSDGAKAGDLDQVILGRAGAWKVIEI